MGEAISRIGSKRIACRGPRSWRIEAMVSNQQTSALDPTKKAFSLYEEFKGFAFKGNVIDLAVGVIIGAAFGKIVDSLVKQIIMPLVSVLLPSNQSYVGWKWVIDGKEIPYGLFLGEVVNFLIVAATLFFFVVKFLGWVTKTKKQEAVAPLRLTKDQELLVEIRDLLKSTNLLQ
jgi:large conductance mechanosensitive channel